MLSHANTNRKRRQCAVLSSITNVNVSQNNNSKRIKLKVNQNILSSNYKKVSPNTSVQAGSCLNAQSISSLTLNQRKRSQSAALSSITNVHQNSSNNNKRIKLCNQPQQVNSKLSNCSTVNRALHLNHLPFDCLSSILSRISLQQRITRLCLVCHHWKSTVDEMCRIKGQLTINLFSSHKPEVMQLVTSDLEQYWSNVRHERMESLLLSKPKNQIFSDLSTRFPLVTHLVIRSNDTTKRQNRASLQLLLSIFRQQNWPLTCLTLIKMSIITDPTFLPQLCSMINHKFAKQFQFKQLNLYIQAFGPETAACHPEQVELWSVLPQLERFFVICPFKNWGSVMRTLGDPINRCKVRELELCEDRLSPEDLNRLLSLTMFTSTVTHLHLTFVSSRAWFSIICESFGLLQFLQIYIGYNKFDADWFSDLGKLSHLSELKMHRFQLDPTTVNIVPLPTIKKLTICDSQLLTNFRVTGENRFNADHYCRLLSHHFPSVSRLILFSNEKSFKVAERNIRKWAYVHFKQIHKLVLVLKAKEYVNRCRAQKKFLREHRKSLRN